MGDADAFVKGSSPRVRGAAAGRGARPVRAGLIPAGAGSGTPRRTASTSRRAHPRGCGERGCKPDGTVLDPGSSPRVRGAVRPRTAGRRRDGLIPAGAGSGTGACAQTPPVRAHPRGCGERVSGASGVRRSMGSSPRVRGAGDDHRRDLGERGLIPAGAGSGGPARRSAPWCRAHPRGCGERTVTHAERGPVVGSSPRVRGAVLGHSLRPVQHGLIPAGAGSGVGHVFLLEGAWAHPRGCGERVFLGRHH